MGRSSKIDGSNQKLCGGQNEHRYAAALLYVVHRAVLSRDAVRNAQRYSLDVGDTKPMKARPYQI